MGLVSWLCSVVVKVLFVVGLVMSGVMWWVVVKVVFFVFLLYLNGMIFRIIVSLFMFNVFKLM